MPEILRSLASCFFQSLMLQVWNIYLHLDDFEANVGKYSIHGAYGNVFPWAPYKRDI
jgi:hypothetical protein